MKTPINKNSLLKTKAVVSDKDFRNHLKDSATSAVKAGSRAKSVTRSKRKCHRKNAVNVLSILVVIGMVGLIIKSAASKNK